MNDIAIGSIGFLILLWVISWFRTKRTWIESLFNPKIRVPHFFDDLDFRKRRDRRIGMRWLMKREGIRRPVYLSPKNWCIFRADIKQMMLEELLTKRKI